jgi:hypothetical protein
VNRDSHDRFIGEGPDEQICFCGSGEEAIGTCYLCGDPICSDCFVEGANCYNERNDYLGQHDICPGCQEEIS